MNIAICGAQNTGKSTLTEDFLKEWPMYKRSAESYRALVKEQNIPLNKLVTKDGQRKILDCLVSDIKAVPRNGHTLFDRFTLDNLVYSLWAMDKQSSDIDKAFIDECILDVKESMRKIDIIFFIPITAAAPIPLVDRQHREVDTTYVKEIDNIFKAISYQHRKSGSPFFPKDDAPPIIEVFGKPLERIELIKMYVNKYGDCVDTVNSVLTDENITAVEQLLREQGLALEDEKKLSDLKSKIIKAPRGTFDKKRLPGQPLY